jgi:hypothetical protein
MGLRIIIVLFEKVAKFKTIINQTRAFHSKETAGKSLSTQHTSATALRPLLSD